jgi:hypothetical protein
MKGISSLRQHLLTNQVVDLFTKFGFRQEDIIFSITDAANSFAPIASVQINTAIDTAPPIPGDFVGNDISSPEALQVEIRKLIDEGNFEGKVILFKVGADGREFKESAGENNHYVALYFKDWHINYIDPTGEGISESVRGVIQSSHASLATSQIISSTTALQYTTERNIGQTHYEMGGNDYDCGVLLPLVVNMINTNYPERGNVRLNGQDSEYLCQILRTVLNNQSTIEDASQGIYGILQNGLRRELPQIYNSTEMELVALEQLRKNFPTAEDQQAEVTRLIQEFGNKDLRDKKTQIPNPRRPGKFLTKTESGAEKDILDIMCLGQLLFEGGNKKIGRQLQIAVLAIDSEDVQYPNNLTFLQKCLTNFKPSIYKNLREHFSQKYEIYESEVKILPKATGQQVGAKIVIPDSANPGKLKTFYVKSHQEFSSKSHPQLGTRTSNGLGSVDLKELFMYKVLEKVGYGPKVEFVIDKDIAGSRVEEGVMIITQDSGYTKTPELKQKSFRDFKDIKDQIDPELAGPETRRDLIAIDMLSRIFCLGDVMVNEGNFGRVDRVNLQTKELMPEKWKILDFTAPKVAKGKEHLGDRKYLYGPYYGGDRVSIEHGFKTGSFSHVYHEESPVSKILRSKKTEDLWGRTLSDLGGGKSEGKLGLQEAINESLDEIMQFLDRNKDKLVLQDEGRADYKEQTQRRIEDLNIFCRCASQNYQDLTQGMQQSKNLTEHYNQRLFALI